jgi:hypothetical protein
MEKKRAGIGKIKNRIYGLLARYILTFLISLNSLFIFYFVFTPLTLWPAYFLLSLFYQASVAGNAILINGNVFLLNEACIAGSAYFLLAILNLTTPGIKSLKRARIFLFDSLLLLAFNIVRIFGLSAALLAGFVFFDFLHVLIWYALSILVVVAIWLLTVKIFRIKDIPILGDLIFLKNLAKIKRP